MAEANSVQSFGAGLGDSSNLNLNTHSSDQHMQSLEEEEKGSPSTAREEHSSAWGKRMEELEGQMQRGLTKCLQRYVGALKAEPQKRATESGKGKLARIKLIITKLKVV